MRVAFAQIDPVVGAFEANSRKIAEAYERACAAGADLLITPELSVFGYPPHDLVDRPEIFERNEAAVDELQKLTKGKSTALAVGFVALNPAPQGRAAQNVAVILHEGKRVFSQAKTLLPTYDVFDEARYFEPATESRAWEFKGKKLGIAICEDLWGRDPSIGSSLQSSTGRKLYQRDPIDAIGKLGVDFLISLSSSPYIQGKRAHREELHAEVARAVGVPLLYVNQVGATDEVLFDGGSFALDAKGKLLGRLPFFATGFGIFDVAKLQWESQPVSEREDSAPADIEILSRALVTGIREYFARTGFKTAILGLSGGIDSAVVATLAARALGPKHVLGVGMPSQHSSGHSLEDAEALARNLGIPFEVRPIKFLNSTAVRELGEPRGGLADLALENLQARLRGLTLMTLSNHYSSLVLTTGNKSELATGYCTLYGDMCGAIAPLGDLYKTQVYALAKHLNATWGGPIPERSITKAPSAELRPDQKDQDTLPPYEVLDELLESYLERGTPVAQLEKTFSKRVPGKPGWVREILRLLEINEYKRRQAAPVLKVSAKAFGIGRRIPIAKQWDQKA
jgi:NAD+ synthetase